MNKNLIGIFATFIVFLIVVNAYSLFGFYNKSNALQTLRDERFSMVLKADELRQSSDDLTRFARTYAVTGETKYKENYFSVLAIRNGESGRPYSYEGIYWNLLEPIRSQRHRTKSPEVLDAEMQKLPYTHTELAMLTKAKVLSDTLVGLEVKAFNAMDGKFVDVEGKYTLQKEADQKLAIALLHSKRYHIEKAKVMLPIDDFIFSVNQRTSLKINVLKKELDMSFYIFIFTLFSSIITVLLFLYVDRKHIKEGLSALNRH